MLRHAEQGDFSHAPRLFAWPCTWTRTQMPCAEHSDSRKRVPCHFEQGDSISTRSTATRVVLHVDKSDLDTGHSDQGNMLRVREQVEGRSKQSSRVPPTWQCTWTRMISTPTTVTKEDMFGYASKETSTQTPHGYLRGVQRGQG